MIVSHKHQFIFIHVPKCAGSSITKALGKFGRVNNKTLFSKVLERLNLPPKFLPVQHFHPHVKASRLKEELPEGVWSKYYKFAVVRNPFDYQVSNYHYIMRSEKHPLYEEVQACKGFKEFILKECNEHLTSKPNVLSRYVYDERGQLLVDYVGRVERLNRDFEVICQRLNIYAPLPHVNKSKRTQYRKYYDEESRKLVEKHHAEDLELFNYSF